MTLSQIPGIALYNDPALIKCLNLFTHFFFSSYLLPDAKKTTKCRTKTRKGKDPFWNEQFLIVNINYHEIKRRALEICIADRNTSVGKKAKFIGGVRLSLGYKAVVSAQTKQVSQVLRLLKGKGGLSGAMTRGKDETREGREAQRKVSFSDKDTVVAKGNSSGMKCKQTNWAKMANESMHRKPNETRDDEEATSDTHENNTSTNGDNTGGKQFTVDKRKDAKEYTDDGIRMNITSNESQSTSSTSITAAGDPDPSVEIERDLGTSLKRCDDGLETDVQENAETQVSSCETVQNTASISEFSYDSGSTEEESCKEDLVQQRFFEPHLGAEDNEVNEPGCISSQGKEDEQSKVNSFNKDNNSEEIEDVLSITNDNQQECGINNCTESGENSPSGIPKNGAEKEVNGMKTELLSNGDLTNKEIDLNDSRKTNNDTKETEKGDENLPNLSEDSRPENDQRIQQQNGSESVIKTESSNPTKTVTEDHPLNTAASEKLEPNESLDGKKFKNASASQYQETNTDGLESKGITTHAKVRNSSTDSNEMKRSPSFTLRDLGKKLNLRRRNSSSEGEGKGPETSLETGANKIMLDAEGLEVTQWNLMVERPKQWHYCWHILRSEMTLLH